MNSEILLYFSVKYKKLGILYYYQSMFELDIIKYLLLCVKRTNLNLMMIYNTFKYNILNESDIASENCS